MYYIFNIHLIEVLKVYSPSKASWKCNLAKLQMLMKHKNGKKKPTTKYILSEGMDQQSISIRYQLLVDRISNEKKTAKT